MRCIGNVFFFWKSTNEVHQSQTHWRTLTPWLTQSFTHSVIRSFTHPVIHSFTYSAIHSFSHSLVQSFVHSLTQSFTHSFIHSLSHLLIRSFTHSVNLSFSHSLINESTICSPSNKLWTAVRPPLPQGCQQKHIHNFRYHKPATSQDPVTLLPARITSSLLTVERPWDMGIRSCS